MILLKGIHNINLRKLIININIDLCCTSDTDVQKCIENKQPDLFL